MSTKAHRRHTRKARRNANKRTRGKGKAVPSHKAKTGRTGSVHEKRQRPRSAFPYRSTKAASMPSATLHARKS